MPKIKFKFRGPIRVLPPGGWEWAENGFKFSGKSPEELAVKVKEHRESNRLPSGDPFDEIEQFYCAKFPDLGFSVAEAEKHQTYQHYQHQHLFLNLAMYLLLVQSNRGLVKFQI